MSKPVTLEIPHDIAYAADQLAKRIHAQPDVFLRRCIVDGMAEQAVDMLFNQLHPLLTT